VPAGGSVFGAVLGRRHRACGTGWPTLGGWGVGTSWLSVIPGVTRASHGAGWASHPQLTTYGGLGTLHCSRHWGITPVGCGGSMVTTMVSLSVAASMSQ